MDETVEYIAETDSRSAFGRFVAGLIGMCALVTALLVTLEVHLASRDGHADSLSSRLAVEITQDGVSSNTRDAFATLIKSEAKDFMATGRDRALVSTIAPDPTAADIESAIATAEKSAAIPLLRTAEAMGQPPHGSSGLDPVTLRSLSVTTRTLVAEDATQGRLLDEVARTRGQRGRIVLALTLVAIAASLLGLAAMLRTGRGGWLAVIVAGILVSASIVIGATALL
jgi:hypothetical protein